MDFISLDVIPKESQFDSPIELATTKVAPTAPPFYASSVYKGIMLILFVSILCFPQPEWLVAMLSHPVGALALASLVALALLPEIEWWIIVIGVGVVYILFAITGMIESNLEHRRKKVEEETQTKKQKEEAEAETEQEGVEFRSAPMMEPVAANVWISIVSRIMSYIFIIIIVGMLLAFVFLAPKDVKESFRQS